MGQWTRTPSAHGLLASPGPPGGGLRQPIRRAAAALALVAGVALAAWLVRAWLGPEGWGWAGRLAGTLGGWLHAAWSAGP